METMTALPWGRPLTHEDFEEIRAVEDGHRYELVDGTLLVTPGPGWPHQRVSMRLLLLIHRQLPAGTELLHAPFDIRLGPATTLQPDLLVARVDDLTAKALPAAPLLAVEILSPSTRHIDLGLKKSRYEAAGCEHYWVVDPDEPSFTAWRLVDGSYREVAHAVGDQVASLTQPVDIRLVPLSLVE